ncbi:MAG: hypothetical protein ACHQFW_10015, partial [Chitinophagales bacterium]
VALTITFCFLYFDGELKFIIVVTYSVIIALISALTELFSRKGLDNFTIPATVMMILYLFFII